MCYRFTLRAPPAVVAQFFDLTEWPAHTPRFNIALSQQLLAVRRDVSGQRTWATFKWGLIPRWNREAKPKGFGNAQAETVHEKPSFRVAYQKRRCLVPADGFYEWEDVGGKKQPWHFHLASGGLFAFAGIWEAWRNPEGEVVETCAILTTEPNELIAGMHNRMPVMLSAASMDRWTAETALDDATRNELTRPFPAELMEGLRVNPRVNNPRHEGADCLEAVTEA